MILILGKTASGKTTIVNKLVKEYGFNKIVTYTTRPIRKGEINGVDYHFISEKDFLSKIKNGFFAEWKVYFAKQGTWYYGSSFSDIVNANEKSILIITPDGLRELKEKYNFKTFSIYIDCNKSIIEQRLINRGDLPDEAKRRYAADCKDFKYIKKDADRIVYNNNDIDSVVTDILQLIDERKIKKDIFVDFDNTVVNSIKRIVELYNEDYQYYDNFKHINWTDIKTWEFNECKCSHKEAINAYFNMKRFFDEVELMPYAKEVLFKLSENYNITIVSCGTTPNLKLKKIWIEDNLPFCRFIGVNFKDKSDKSSVDMNDAIFIDDVARFLDSNNAKYNICFGDIYKWNEEWTGKRCYNWCEVENYIKEIERKGDN